MNKKLDGFIKEFARDLIAFGSIPFYAIFIIRGAIGPIQPFLNRIIFGAVVLFVIWIVFRKHIDMYIARASVLGVFSSLSYMDLKFAIMAGILWVLMIASSIYVRRNEKQVIAGIISGAVTIALAYGVFS